MRKGQRRPITNQASSAPSFLAPHTPPGVPRTPPPALAPPPPVPQALGVPQYQAAPPVTPQAPAGAPQYRPVPPVPVAPEYRVWAGYGPPSATPTPRGVPVANKPPPFGWIGGGGGVFKYASPNPVVPPPPRIR